MYPKPSVNFFPTGYKRDAKLTALTDYLDSLLLSIHNDIIGLNYLLDPVRCPEQLIIYLGQYLNAGIKQSDTEAQKRYKCAKAVETHKKRGSWEEDAKIKVDIICGGDSSIIRSFDLDDWILVGDGLTPSAYYWAALGCDGIDDDLGISLIGSGYEIEVAGNIFIDVDNNSLSAGDQASLQEDMIDVVPGYCYVHFGYVDGSGDFIEYFVME
jgi:phage tail-like protein